MTVNQESPPLTSNQLLNKLLLKDYERLSAYFEPVSFQHGEVIYRPDEPIEYVYFPNRGIISVLSTFEDGGSVEVGIVGNEGMFGISVLLGSVTLPLSAIVQLSGDGLQIRVDKIREEFKRAGQMQDLLLRYAQAFFIQIAQTAACNRHHHIDEQLARWLLTCQDRAMSADLKLTHEFIGLMLGLRRAGVTVAAGKLQDEGLIKYKHGQIKILDRKGLEAKSCVCYQIVKREFDRLLG